MFFILPSTKTKQANLKLWEVRNKLLQTGGAWFFFYSENSGEKDSQFGPESFQTRVTRWQDNTNYVGVSKNSVTPKSSILIGFSIIL